MISEDIKIASLVKENPMIVDLIKSISPKLDSIKKEFIINNIGKRTTLKNVAEIENISTQDFLNYIKISLGEISDLTINEDENESSKTEKSDFNLNIREEDLIEVDVREDILNGIDPITKIKEAIVKLNEKNAIKLINFFEPYPLYEALSKKGIKHSSELISDKWIIYFFKN